MVATGPDINASGEDLGCSFWRDAGAAGGIFAVGNHQIDPSCLANLWQQFLDHAAAGLADDICDKQNLHCFTVLAVESRASFELRARSSAFRLNIPSLT